MDVHNLVREPLKQETARSFNVSWPGLRIFCDLGKSCPDLQLESGSSDGAPLAIPGSRRKSFCVGGFKNLNDDRHSPLP